MVVASFSCARKAALLLDWPSATSRSLLLVHTFLSVRAVVHSSLLTKQAVFIRTRTDPRTSSWALKFIRNRTTRSTPLHAAIVRYTCLKYHKQDNETDKRMQPRPRPQSVKSPALVWLPSFSSHFPPFLPQNLRSDKSAPGFKSHEARSVEASSRRLHSRHSSGEVTEFWKWYALLDSSPVRHTWTLLVRPTGVDTPKPIPLSVYKVPCETINCVCCWPCISPVYI
jgi:hypothetical protein